VRLPRADGTLFRYTLHEPRSFPPPDGPLKSRVIYAAAHVVCDPLAENRLGAPARLNWEATLDYRRYLWSLGLAVAEAMDTAQRGMGLDWTSAKELIRHTVSEAKAAEARVACGAGTDHLSPHPKASLADVITAYEEQCGFVEGEGAQVILMASRELAAIAETSDEYMEVYRRVLSQVSRPVILHWLGDMFDPVLAGYWGSRDLDVASEVCLQIIRDNAGKIDGIKLSLLDKSREIALRKRLPEGVKLYTGDDFNYQELIRGDGDCYSHALLGIFDAIAPAASAAVQALDERDLERYEAILAPTVPLSRHIFQAPTYYYKTGIVFLAYLNGHQAHFRMVQGLESARSAVHLAELFMLADRSGLLCRPELAAKRMRTVMTLAGIDQGSQ
jgi:hypothetical protein